MYPSAAPSGFDLSRSRSPLDVLSAPLILLGNTARAGPAAGFEVAGAIYRGIEILTRNTVFRGVSGVWGVVSGGATSSNVHVLDEHTTFTQSSGHAVRHLKAPRHKTRTQARTQLARTDTLAFDMGRRTTVPASNSRADRLPIDMGLQASML